MISANTVLNIINESGTERLKGILPSKSYELIKRKYERKTELPYLKELIKKHEKNEKMMIKQIKSSLKE